jgi:hypothetical protein
MGKKLMIEELNRIKSLMGILKEDASESDDTGLGMVPDYEFPNIFRTKECYPSDYEPGKKYEQKELSKIFSCFAGEKDFPVDGVMEWMFPLIPPFGDRKHHISPSYDPKNMQMGPNEYYTMKEWVDKQKKEVSHLSLEMISIKPDQIHPDTIKFIPEKESAKGGEERIEFQMRRALKDGVETLTDNEPFVVELIDGLYKFDEGWNRMIALKRLYEQGKIPEIKGKSWVVHKIK